MKVSDFMKSVLSANGPPQPITRFVLVALAQFANWRTGENCFPTVNSIVSKTRLSKTTVCLHLNKAAKLGWINRVSLGNGQGWRRTKYHLQIPPFEQQIIDERGQADGPRSGHNVDQQADNVDQQADKRGPAAGPNQYHYPITTNKKRAVTGTTPLPARRKKDESDEFKNVASSMLNDIRERLPKFKQPIIATWTNQVRLMVERDSRTLQEISTVWRWANAHDFWQRNILSPAKLRKQFDSLQSQMAPSKTSGLTRREIGRHARPGESWDEAERRISNERI